MIRAPPIRGLKQTAYQIITENWDSGKVVSDSMRAVYPEPLHSRERVNWKLRLWDENGESGDWSEAFFEMGLLEKTDWTAKWITGDYTPSKKERYPVDCFRKIFTVRKNVRRARLYITACGLYEAKLNGGKVGSFCFAPGHTDYRRRVQVQTYDVTDRLKPGENELTVQLADGWYRGSCGAWGLTNQYGTETKLLCQLEYEYESGLRETVISDRSWQWSNDGPIRFADNKDGEIVEAFRTPFYRGKAKETSHPVVPTASNNVPVTEHERLSAKLLKNNVLDFGQNIAGYLQFAVRGRKGQTFRLVCGEVLDTDGNVDLHGIQESRPAKGWKGLNLVKKLMTGKVNGEINPTPHQEIVFTCSGGVDEYKTSFAVFGFRYAQVIGDIAVNPNGFTAIAVYSDMEQTGSFTCSNDLVNKLVQNTLWSMKGNFLDVPTDCPTRERLGWTGDAQIFFDTGAYLMNTAPFFRKWLKDMADDQYDNGLISAVIPFSGAEMMYKATGSSVGWADAVYLVPWRYYLRYEDRQVLETAWPMIEKYARYLLNNLGMRDKKEGKVNPDNAFTYEKGVHLGEWLEPEEFRDKVYGTRAKHPEECTAYLHYSMKTITKIAKLLGKPHAEYEKCAEGAKKAYLRFAELDTNRQAKLVRPLALGLLEGETKAKAQKRLVQAAEIYNHRVGTGFLSTPFILPVLIEAGEVDAAYRMLLNTEKPGWLGEVLDGATTIWENWEGDLSQNHYSPGAVCQWLFDTCAGIRVDGENHFTLAPVPGPGLEHAGAKYLSPYGEVKSTWRRTNSKVAFEIVIPANCEAEIRLPDGRKETVTTGRYTF